MSKIKPFNEHINESSEENMRRLIELGLAPEFDERYYGMINAWSSDPEIDRLLTALNLRTADIIRQWIDPEKDADDVEALQEELAENDVDEIGKGAQNLLAGDPTRSVWGLGRHFLGSNLFWYFRDPMGNYAEYYADLDQIPSACKNWFTVGRWADVVDWAYDGIGMLAGLAAVTLGVALLGGPRREGRTQ